MQNKDLGTICFKTQLIPFTETPCLEENMWDDAWFLHLPVIIGYFKPTKLFTLKKGTR